MAFSTSGVSSIYSDKIIFIRNVNLKYSERNSVVTALQNINLDILRGEFVCLLGPSGCGKSSLLSIIGGIQKPTEGTAAMNGREINGTDNSRMMMFQTPTLSDEIRICDNVSFGVRRRKVDKDEVSEKVRFYMELTGVEKFEDKKPYELSESMRYRAALARLLAHKPEIIIMDEPFFNLNSEEREDMQDLMRKIWKKTGMTVLCVPNDVDEALSLATRIIVMSANPGQVVKEFRTEFTREIDGENRKNVRCSKEYAEMREEILELIRA